MIPAETTAATAEPTDAATTAPAGGYSEPWEVSPGIDGFLTFFALALALMVLARMMLRSVRRVDHASGHRPTAPVPEGGIASDARVPRDAPETDVPGSRGN